MTCKHGRTTSSDPRCYTGGVAVAPYTDQDPRAAGGTTVTVTCGACGAQRRENRNAGYIEVSPWSPSRAQRERMAEARAQDANRHANPDLLSVRADGMIVLATPARFAGASVTEIWPLAPQAGSVELAPGARLDQWAGWRDACAAAEVAS